MISDVPVYLGSTLVGRLSTFGSGRAETSRFRYSDSYLSSPHAIAIDPALPLCTGDFESAVGQPLFNCFADAAPDRWGRRLLELSAHAPEREFDVLLGARDDLRQGALRLRIDETGDFVASSSDGIPPMPSLEELLTAADRVDQREPVDATLEALLNAGSSIGGERPKAAVMQDGVLMIAKFPRPSTDAWDVMAWEHIALGLARDAGINVADTTLVDVASRHVLLVERFDRRGSERIPHCSAQTLLEARLGDTRSYEDIAEAIATFGVDVEAELRELFRRIAFTCLITNTDDHLKNHGFLLDDRSRGWKLSPMFDVNPNPLPTRPILSTLIVYGNATPEINLLIDEHRTYRLTRDAAGSIVGEVRSVVSRWRDRASSIGIPTAEIDRMATAFRV